MKFARTLSSLLLMLPLLAVGTLGCRHKLPPPAPPPATAPPLPPSSMTQVPAVPPMPAPSQPQVGPPGSDQVAQEAPPPPAHHPRHSKKHTPDAPAGPASSATPAPTQVASATPPPAPTLGELSAGTGVDTRERAAMTEQIHGQETRLGKIKHSQSEEDQAITTQIRVFLAKARQAVSENDLDGAQTLTTKAKVLLDELTESSSHD